MRPTAPTRNRRSTSSPATSPAECRATLACERAQRYDASPQRRAAARPAGARFTALSNPQGDGMTTRQSRPAVLDQIGNTPLVQVTRLDTGPCTLFLKLENQNPGGSIKDRIGLAMVDTAERDGGLKPGGTVVEATAGNTGLGLALVARAKGYRVVLVVPDKMPTEKVLHLKALGAEVHITRSDVGKGHPDYYQDVAARLARDIPRAFFADQFHNPANPPAPPTRTRPEL